MGLDCWVLGKRKRCSNGWTSGPGGPKVPFYWGFHVFLCAWVEGRSRSICVKLALALVCGVVLLSVHPLGMGSGGSNEKRTKR